MHREEIKLQRPRVVNHGLPSKIGDVGYRTSWFLCSMPAQSQIREVIAEIDVSWTEGA